MGYAEMYIPFLEYIEVILKYSNPKKCGIILFVDTIEGKREVGL